MPAYEICPRKDDKGDNIFALDNGIVKFSPDGKRTPFAANPIN
jgi:hypothetical protein